MSGKRALSTWVCNWIEGKHLQIANAKAIKCGAALTRLMPNIGVPREAKRRLVASIVNSKLLYAAQVWTSAVNNHAILKKLFSAERCGAENSLSIPNCLHECCAGPGERPAN